ncbi:phytase [bacterium]|nr:phytase [bacterium]
MIHIQPLLILLSVWLLTSCGSQTQTNAVDSKQPGEAAMEETNAAGKISPAVITEKTTEDTDDPCIWVNQEDRSKSLIIGTDKNDENGGLFVFDLDGKIIRDKCLTGMKRPNNVDLEYGFDNNGQPIDIAVCTERGTNSIRVVQVPQMKFIDNGGIPVFEGETDRAPMGIALYKNAKGKVYAVVSRKTGPSGSYLWQYELAADANGAVSGKVVRKFGTFEGAEIEAVLVDDALGHVYYSDETVGVRQYYADPEKGNEQLALFATEGIASDQEGLSLYPTGAGSGYILLSDQQANLFWVFSREGSAENPYEHKLLKKIATSTDESDGSDVSPYALGPNFPNGIFVAMSNGGVFHFYRWEDLAGNDLKVEVK